MDREAPEHWNRIERTTREVCAALRAIFETASLSDELERIGIAEELLARLRGELDELDQLSAAAS
jgi:hypothetical protein